VEIEAADRDVLLKLYEVIIRPVLLRKKIQADQVTIIP
jgi:hypothetical protein